MLNSAGKVTFSDLDFYGKRKPADSLSSSEMQSLIKSISSFATKSAKAEMNIQKLK